MNDITVRRMGPEDVKEAMEIKSEEGWNQTENDWKFLIRHNPQACLVAVSDRQIVGTVTAMRYHTQLAWIGMMLVRKEYRGQGIGQLLMRHILQRLTNMTAVKLDATPAGRQVYVKLGFLDEYPISRLTASSLYLPTTSQDKLAGKLVAINRQALPAIAQYDQERLGVDRSLLLSYLLAQAPGTSYQLIIDNRLCGFVMQRAGSRYTQVGPLVADSEENAKMLLARILEDINRRSHPVVLDILQDKKTLIDWLRLWGFSEQRSFIRMYYGGHPNPGNMSSMYLISGPELG